MAEDEFEPRLGKPRSRGSRSGKRYAHQVLAAVNRTGGRAPRTEFGRIGRRDAPAAALAGRQRLASLSQHRDRQGIDRPLGWDRGMVLVPV